jgi:metal-responsive CopG/Arc/MetJ family transcriptional regulator
MEMRTLVDLPEADVRSLDAMAKAQNASRAKLIRAAVEAFLKAKSEDPIDASFGAWKNKDIDGLDYQRKIRDEW